MIFGVSNWFECPLLALFSSFVLINHCPKLRSFNVYLLWLATMYSDGLGALIFSVQKLPENLDLKQLLSVR